MIEVYIDPDASLTGTCPFCWRRCDTPQTLPTVVYEHGRRYKGAIACDFCLWVDEKLLRREMLGLAARLREDVGTAEAVEMAAELRDAATGDIRRPHPEVLELERIYYLDVAKPDAPQRHEIEIDVDGKPYSGWYSVGARALTVSDGFRSKSTQVGGSSPQHLAKLLLRELVEESENYRQP